MSDPKDKRPQQPPETPAAGESGTDKRSGRVSYDSRGNPVWEWQLETGVYSRDVSTQKLEKLDLGDLSIADTAIGKKPQGLDEDSPPLPGGGFNPYDNMPQRARGSNPYDTAHSRNDPFVPKKPEPPAKTRSLDDMRKLDAWIKQKKKTEQDEGE